jgi:hypothetical protein
MPANVPGFVDGYSACRLRADFRCWHKADVPIALIDVRFRE